MTSTLCNIYKSFTPDDGFPVEKSLADDMYCSFYRMI